MRPNDVSAAELMDKFVPLLDERDEEANDFAVLESLY
jgi:hypothetical protein